MECVGGRTPSLTESAQDMSVTVIRIERRKLPGKESSPSNANQIIQAPAPSIPNKGGYRQIPVQKQARPRTSLCGNNLTLEHKKKFSNQTGPVMVHALQIICLRAIVGTILHSNGDSLSKRRRLKVSTCMAFSLRKEQLKRKALPNSARTSSLSTIER